MFSMTAAMHKRVSMSGNAGKVNQNPEKGISRSLVDHLIGFLIIGCFTTCTDITLLWALTDLLGIWYLASAGLSYCLSALFSFGLNKVLNFKNQSQEHVKQVSAFLVIAASSLIVNLLIISVCVEMWSFNYLTAKVFATGVAFLWNYFGQSSVTFRLWR